MNIADFKKIMAPDLQPFKPVKPVAPHPDRPASLKDRFWAEYSQNVNRVEYRYNVPAVQFELEAIQRPPARRTASLPGTRKRRWPTGPVTKKRGSFRSGVKKIKNTLRLTRDRIRQTKGDVALWAHRHRRPLKFAAAGLIAALALTVNYKAAVTKAAQPSLLSHYPQVPTWMHADSPAKILNMPDPIAPTIVNVNEYKAAFKKWSHIMHPDRAHYNGIRKAGVNADKVYSRALNAVDAVDKFWKNPYCEDNIEAVENFDASGDGLPSFAKGCPRCSYPRAVGEVVARAVVPAFLQAKPPKTIDQLGQYCPSCTFAVAGANWASFDTPNRPPALARIRDAISYGQVFEDPRLLWFKLSDLWEVSEDSERSTEEKRAMEEAGWANGAEDWLEEFARGCRANMPRNPKSRRPA